MKLSDCPHPVGTPEHSRWVRTVFIPSETQRGRYDEDAARYGATAQGRRLIRDNRRITYTLTLDASRFNQSMADMRDAMAQAAAAIAPSVQGVVRWIETLATECRPNPTLPIIASQRRRRHR